MLNYPGGPVIIQREARGSVREGDVRTETGVG